MPAQTAAVARELIAPVASSKPLRAMMLRVDMIGNIPGYIQRHMLYILALLKVRKRYGMSKSCRRTEVTPEIDSE